jgi:hypothetical protein
MAETVLWMTDVEAEPESFRGWRIGTQYNGGALWVRHPDPAINEWIAWDDVADAPIGRAKHG